MIGRTLDEDGLLVSDVVGELRRKEGEPVSDMMGIYELIAADSDSKLTPEIQSSLSSMGGALNRRGYIKPPTAFGEPDLEHEVARSALTVEVLFADSAGEDRPETWLSLMLLGKSEVEIADLSEFVMGDIVRPSDWSEVELGECSRSVKRLYEEGKNRTQITEKLGINHYVVKSITTYLFATRRLGHKGQYSLARRDFTKEQARYFARRIVELRKQKVTRMEIVSQLSLP